jgi:hypothetical protein
MREGRQNLYGIAAPFLFYGRFARIGTDEADPRNKGLEFSIVN